MNHKSILLLFCCLITPLSTAFGVPNDRHISNNQIPEITPGELLIRVTPDALAELKLLNARASLSKLHNQMGVQSVDRVFPYIAYPKLNPNLERTYRLRFPPTLDLNALKAIYTADPLIEEVEFQLSTSNTRFGGCAQRPAIWRTVEICRSSTCPKRGQLKKGTRTWSSES